MLLDEKIEQLQNLTKSKIPYTRVAQVLGLGSTQAAYNRINRKTPLKEFEILKLEEAFLKDIKPEEPETKSVSLDEIKDKLNQLESKVKKMPLKKGTATIIYRPDVKFSAGYGLENYDDGDADYITLDLNIFRTEKGLNVNPKNCELLTVSGNSMFPKWEDGDRFILNKSVKEFIDGQIFAFRHNGQCFVKEICLLGKRAKAIPLNKEYDEFYIEPEDELTIFGRVLPKIRL